MVLVMSVQAASCALASLSFILSPWQSWFTRFGFLRYVFRRSLSRVENVAISFLSGSWDVMVS